MLRISQNTEIISSEDTVYKISMFCRYLTSVSWMDEDRVIVVWLMTDHQSEKFFICNCKTKQCSLVSS